MHTIAQGGLSSQPVVATADLFPVGGTVKLVSPWKQQSFTVVEQESNASVSVTTEAGISSFPTAVGKTYVLY